jgi:hypothetical protein
MNAGVAYTRILETIDAKTSSILERVDTLVDMQEQLSDQIADVGAHETCVVRWRISPKMRFMTKQLEFYGVASASGQKYEACLSTPFPRAMTEVGQGRLIPADTKRAQATLDEMLLGLEEDGWEITSWGDLWYDAHYRRRS